MAEQTVTLNSGESKMVSFEAVPHEAKAYQVLLDGLSGSFTAKAKAYPCRYCPATFSTPQELTQHVISSHACLDFSVRGENWRKEWVEFPEPYWDCSIEIPWVVIYGMPLDISAPGPGRKELDAICSFHIINIAGWEILRYPFTVPVIIDGPWSIYGGFGEMVRRTLTITQDCVVVYDDATRSFRVER